MIYAHLYAISQCYTRKISCGACYVATNIMPMFTSKLCYIANTINCMLYTICYIAYLGCYITFENIKY